MERLSRDMRYGPLRPLSFARIVSGIGTCSIGGKSLPYDQVRVNSWSGSKLPHRNSKLHWSTSQWVCDE